MQAVATIEMPAGSSYKYEVNKNTGKLVLDRVLNVSVPHNYGYVNNTLFADGDPIDIFVVSERPIPSLCEVTVDIVGILKCIDNGVSDDKLIGIISGDKYSLGLDLEYSNTLQVIKIYLHTYKTGFEVLEFCDVNVARKILKQSQKDYEDYKDDI